MKNIEQFKELNNKELIEISGGGEGFFYKMGYLWVDTNLRILGAAAGIIDGFESGLD